VPVGTGLAGPIAATLGTRAVLSTVAGLAVLVTVSTLAIPAVWRVRGAFLEPSRTFARERI
jgi:hypothetical protein